MKKNILPWIKTILYGKTIFRRLILSFICILLPIFVLNIVIYNWSVTTLREEISTSMEAQVSYYMDGLENEIERIRNLQNNCIGDVSLNKLSAIAESLTNIERKNNIRQLQQRLSNLLDSSTYINDVFVMIPSLDRKITAFSVSEFKRDDFDRLRYNPIGATGQLLSVDERLFLSTEYPYYGVGRGKEPIFIIVVELSKVRIEEQLRLMNSYGNDGAILTYADGGLYLASAADVDFNAEVLRSIKDKPARDGAVGSLYIDGKPYLLLYRTSDYLGMTLCKFVPQEYVYSAVRKYAVWFVLLIIAAVVIIVLYSLYTYRIIHKPLNKLAKSFGNVENGELNFCIEHNWDDEFRYIFSRFNIMVKNLENLIEQVYKQKILAQEAELKQLQSQINPHFLYNSFFILKTMARIGDSDELERFTEQLGKYFQFLTRTASDDVTLQNEVEHAKAYSEIQATRFSNRISPEFAELPEAYADYIVPRLILQPLIENAFEHGLKNIRQKGIIKVSFEETEDEFQIITEDNGTALSDEKLTELMGISEDKDENAEVTGMKNIDRRIKLKYKQQTGLRISQSALGGLKVTICIKLHKE